MTRDAHKSKVYDAEFELRFISRNNTGSIDFYGSTLDLPAMRKFGDLVGVQAYVNQVYALDQVKEKYPIWRGEPPKVVPRGGDMAAHYSPSTHWIAIPEHKGSQHSWAMDEIVVLHEIAHSLTPRTHHGPEFCKCFIDLLNWCVGGGWSMLMMRALDQRGVPFS